MRVRKGSVTTDGLIDCAAARHDARAQRHVAAANLARGKRRDERRVRLWSARHHQKPARILVEPMNDAGARHPVERRIEGEEAILQGIACITGSGMHHEPPRVC